MNRRALFAAAAALGVSLSANGNPFFSRRGPGGFLILAEQRFDPAVQRYLAEPALRALPLYNGQLYYVYPADASRSQLEEAQIRYLEVLIANRRATDEPADR